MECQLVDGFRDLPEVFTKDLLLIGISVHARLSKEPINAILYTPCELNLVIILSYSVIIGQQKTFVSCFEIARR